jgi:hypothetical protein
LLDIAQSPTSSTTTTFNANKKNKIKILKANQVVSNRDYLNPKSDILTLAPFNKPIMPSNPAFRKLPRIREYIRTIIMVLVFNVCGDHAEFEINSNSILRNCFQIT